MKLYKVKVKGMQYSVTGNRVHGEAYVIAEGLDEAHKKMKKYLDEKDFGFSCERELDSIDVIADDLDYGGTRYKLIL